MSTKSCKASFIWSSRFSAFGSALACCSFSSRARANSTYSFSRTSCCNAESRILSISRSFKGSRFLACCATALITTRSRHATPSLIIAFASKHTSQQLGPERLELIDDGLHSGLVVHTHVHLGFPEMGRDATNLDLGVLDFLAGGDGCFVRLVTIVGDILQVGMKFIPAFRLQGVEGSSMLALGRLHIQIGLLIYLRCLCARHQLLQGFFFASRGS